MYMYTNIVRVQHIRWFKRPMPLTFIPYAENGFLAPSRDPLVPRLLLVLPLYLSYSTLEPSAVRGLPSVSIRGPS